MKKDSTKYLVSLLLFGANGVVASFIALGSGQIVLLRSVLGSALLLTLFYIGGGRLSGLKNRRDVRLIALSGAAMAADWLFLYEAYTRIGVSLSILINYTGPALVIALSPLVLREKLTMRKLCALALALIGAVLISGRVVSGGMDVWGIACAALSAVAYAVMVLSNKLTTEIKRSDNALLQILFTTAVVAVYSALRGSFAMNIAASDWLPILLLGFVNTGLGCFFYFSSIGGLPAQTVAICGYLEPMSAVLLSAIILGERMSPVQILGAALILAGAGIGEMRKRADSV
jgi:drug/metabolite transporter (DMT)-like permease